MNWIDYTKQKPTDKDAQYLIYYRWQPDMMLVNEIAQWNGNSFSNFDWETGYETIYGDKVKYWMKIEEPTKTCNSDKNLQELTWQDAKHIVEIADDTIRKACYEHMSEEEYYTEVLRRFKEGSK